MLRRRLLGRPRAASARGAGCSRCSSPCWAASCASSGSATRTQLIFDETYYVKDAYSYLVSPATSEWPDDANDSFNAGNPDVLLDTPEYVVHPPRGQVADRRRHVAFGTDNAFGWRFGAALTGTLSVLLIALIAQKLFRSLPSAASPGCCWPSTATTWCMSRTSLLDIFLMFWVLAAFGALLLDRDDGRRRLAARLGGGRSRARRACPPRRSCCTGPGWAWRPWRLAAGVCLGLAVGTKWSGAVLRGGLRAA